jgi:hypothetical protein
MPALTVRGPRGGQVSASRAIFIAVGECLRPEGLQPKRNVWCNKFRDGRTALNDDPEKHGGRPRATRTDGNCVTVEGLIREDRRVKVLTMCCKNQFCNISHPLERNAAVEELFQLVLRWDKSHANVS